MTWSSYFTFRLQDHLQQKAIWNLLDALFSQVEKSGVSHGWETDWLTTLRLISIFYYLGLGACHSTWRVGLDQLGISGI